MQVFNISDTGATKAIEAKIRLRKHKLHSTLNLAGKRLSTGNIQEAKSLLLEARHLSLYSSNSLKPEVRNETTDLNNWHAIDKMVKELS